MLPPWEGVRVQAIRVYSPADSPHAHIRVQVYTQAKGMTRMVGNAMFAVAAGDTLSIDSGWCVGKIRIFSILSADAVGIEFPAKTFGWLPNTGSDLVRTMIKPTSGILAGQGPAKSDGGPDYCVLTVEP